MPDPTPKNKGDAYHHLRFSEIPQEHKARVYGMEYAILEQPDGAILYITEHGWPWRANLMPEEWFLDNLYFTKGEMLSGGTGHVYRVPTRTPLTRNIRKDLVVKINRYAQYVPIDVPHFFYDEVAFEEARSAHFNDPFEEFGLLNELRQGWFGPPALRILTKRPMAIYRPAAPIPTWRSGRSENGHYFYQRRLKEDQSASSGFATVHLELERDYIALFEYIKGYDAEHYFHKGLLDAQDLSTLTRRVVDELAAKGFRVLDNKPKHFILREPTPGKLLHRHGKLLYALVDFELLMRTEACKQWLHAHPCFEI